MTCGEVQRTKSASRRVKSRQTLVFALLCSILLIAQADLAGQALSNSQFPSDSEIHQILMQRVDALHQSVGIVVGVIEPNGRRVIAHGTLDKGDNRVVDGNTRLLQTSS